MASKHRQASKGKQASGRGIKGCAERDAAESVVEAAQWSAECNGSAGWLLGWAVGPAGLGQPSVGGCGDVVWLCTDDIPYGGIMS